MDQQEIFKEALAMQEELTTWRHALHQMPELSLDLPKTSAFVQTRLAEMDVPFHTIVNGNGVVAQLGEGEPCLLLRADMDALPVAETSGVDFASTNGCMHACGHDMHTTSLLGAAKLLKAHESELCGTVKLLFQPGEETFNGAEACIKDGVLEIAACRRCRRYACCVDRASRPRCLRQCAERSRLRIQDHPHWQRHPRRYASPRH